MTPPDLAGSALIIIDAQDEYGPGGGLALPHLADALVQLEGLLARARSAGSTVLHIAHHGKPGGLFDPAAGGRILTAAAPEHDETIVAKTLPNAFAGTDLQDHLQALGNPPLILAGFMTHMCVSSTARAALDLGFSTTIAADATATRSLPSPTDGAAITASELQRASLAALSDRFSLVVGCADLV